MICEFNTQGTQLSDKKNNQKKASYQKWSKKSRKKNSKISLSGISKFCRPGWQSLLCCFKNQLPWRDYENACLLNKQTKFFFKKLFSIWFINVQTEEKNFLRTTFNLSQMVFVRQLSTAFDFHSEWNVGSFWKLKFLLVFVIIFVTDIAVTHIISLFVM